MPRERQERSASRRKSGLDHHIERLRGQPVGTVVVLLVLGLMVAGTLAYRFGWVHGFLYVLLAGAAWLRVGTALTPAPPWREAVIESELATVPLAAVWLASSSFGAEALLVFPLGLVVIAGAGARLNPRSARVATGLALALAFAQWRGFGLWRGDLRELVAQVVYIAAFFAAGTFLGRPGLLRRDAARVSDGDTASFAAALGVRDTELLGEGRQETDVEVRLEALGLLCERLLHVARTALGAHSAVLMVRYDEGTFRIFRSSTAEPDLIADPGVASDAGFLGAAVRSQVEQPAPKAIRLADLDPEHQPLPYYERTPARVRSALAVPLRVVSSRPGTVEAAPTVDGVLFFDRTAGGSFDDAALQLGVTAAELLAQALEHERSALAATGHAKVLDRLVASVRDITAAFEPAETHAAILASVARILPTHTAILVERIDGTVADPRTPGSRGIAASGRILLATGEGADALRNAIVPALGSATALTLRNRTTVPPSRVWSDSHGALVSATIGPRPKEGDPAFAIPLVARGEIVGALVVVAKEPVDENLAAQIDVVVGQAAVALAHSKALGDLRERAATDALTGLDNRATLESRLQQSLARASRLAPEGGTEAAAEVAVLVLDLDHFKKVNDTHGHGVGDEVLRRTAAILQGTKRVNDTAARFGGEEFVVVLEQTGKAGAMIVAERIRKRIGDLQIPTSGEPIKVTASIGVAVAPLDGLRSEDLLKRADAALYRAKHAGRNQVKLFSRRGESPAGEGDVAAGAAAESDEPTEA